MQLKINLSIIIPLYNEQESISSCISSCLDFLVNNQDKFSNSELILIDDGSKDFTKMTAIKHLHHAKDILLKLNIKNISFNMYSYPNNEGKGYAIKKGCLIAKYENVMLLDSDLSVKPQLDSSILPYLMPNTPPVLIIGQRKQIIKQPLTRRIAGKIFSFHVNWMFNFKIKDTQCPYKLLHKINPVVNQLTINGFAYDVELIKIAKLLKIEVLPYNVEYFNNKKSKVTIKKIIKMASDLLYLRFKRFPY